MNAQLCLHCERVPQSTLPRLRCLRLCDRCGAYRALRRLYRRPRGWTPAWDAHIQRLVERAKLRLPLAVDQGPLPQPPETVQRQRPPRLPRVVCLLPKVRRKSLSP
jgi:hypothetical protein